MTDRTKQEINADLDSLESTVAKMQSPSWFKSHRTTGSWTSLSLSAITASVSAGVTASVVASIGVSISAFKVDEKGITILGATRDMPWKKWTDRLQKKWESADQRVARQAEEDLKAKVADLDTRAGTVDDRINAAKTSVLGEADTRIDTAKTSILGDVNRIYGPLPGRVDRIESTLRTARRASDAARTHMDTEAQRQGHRGIRPDVSQHLNAHISEDVRNLRAVVDELTNALGTYA